MTSLSAPRSDELPGPLAHIAFGHTITEAQAKRFKTRLQELGVPLLFHEYLNARSNRTMPAVIETWAYCHAKTKTGECAQHDQHIQEGGYWRFLFNSTEVEDVDMVTRDELPRTKVELFTENDTETPEPELLTTDNGYSWADAFTNQFDGHLVSDNVEDVASITRNTLAQWFAMAIEAGRDAGTNAANDRMPMIKAAALREAANDIVVKHPKVATKLRQKAGQIEVHWRKAQDKK